MNTPNFPLNGRMREREGKNCIELHRISDHTDPRVQVGGMSLT